MDLSVHHDRARSRYELLQDGRVVGVADYRLQDGVVVFHHTEIDVDRRGRGLAAVLVQGALDDVRASGRSVVPVCWYVERFIDSHSGYADLLA
jgi:predicted GNAT family acetyltransferase